MLALLVGLHSGTVAAAGTINSKFSLCGDGVNTAARTVPAAMPGTPTASADAAELVAK